MISGFGNFGHFGGHHMGAGPSGISQLKTWTAQQNTTAMTVGDALGSGFARGASAAADFTLRMSRRNRYPTIGL